MRLRYLYLDFLRYKFIVLFFLFIYIAYSVKCNKDQYLPEKSKRSRISLTSLQKREICVVKSEYPHLTLTDLTTRFECGISTVGDILKEKEHWLAIQDDSPDADVKKNKKTSSQMAKVRRSNEH